MGYKYVTDNNLYEKQTYMYSEYRGLDFIKEYVESRKKCLKNVKKIEGRGIKGASSHSRVYEELVELCDNLKTGKNDKEVFALLNAYTKSFEVRKRIYTEYCADWKPVCNAGFEEYGSYLVFAECLLYAYRQTKCLKYFSCLLKLDDTLISIQDRMEQQLKERLDWILIQELDIFSQMAAETVSVRGDCQNDIGEFCTAGF